MSFVPLLPPSTTKSRSQSRESKNQLHFFLRDQFSIGTWLCFGAALQLTVSNLVPRTWTLALYAPLLLIGVKFLNRAIQAIGWKRNPLMDGVIFSKYSSQIPDQDGNFPAKPAEQPITVLLLGARNNHALGPLASGNKELGAYFDKMQSGLDRDGYEKFGYLGSTNWFRGDRKTSNEIMTVLYFRTRAGLEAFAHSPSHREGWDWWNKKSKDLSHIAIYHETYECQPGSWETIYINSVPTLLGATKYPQIIEEEGIKKKAWVYPVVDATRGQLRTHKGRMGMTHGNENEKYGKEPYV